MIRILFFLFFIFPCVLFSKVEYEEKLELYKKQTELAYKAKQELDWLTLIQIAKISHSQKQESIWQESLIKWAEEIIIHKRIPAAAIHLAEYYKIVHNLQQEKHWKDISRIWCQEKHTKCFT